MPKQAYSLLGLACCGAVAGAAAMWGYKQEQHRKARHVGEPCDTPGLDAECGPIQSPSPRRNVNGNATL